MSMAKMCTYTAVEEGETYDGVQRELSAVLHHQDSLNEGG
jgi:hypothetical protein